MTGNRSTSKKSAPRSTSSRRGLPFSRLAAGIVASMDHWLASWPSRRSVARTSLKKPATVLDRERFLRERTLGQPRLPDPRLVVVDGRRRRLVPLRGERLRVGPVLRVHARGQIGG